MTIDEDEDFRFGPDESFTLQCWLCTKENGFMRMISKSGYPAFEVYGYGLYLSDGILEAWFADADRHRVIAARSHKINDGRVAPRGGGDDRPARRLFIYLDGRLDTPDGRPDRQIRRTFRRWARLRPCARCTLGRDFRGLLDEVSIFRGALRSAAIRSSGRLSVALRPDRVDPLCSQRELPEPAAQLARRRAGHRADDGRRSPRRPGHGHR